MLQGLKLRPKSNQGQTSNTGGLPAPASSRRARAGRTNKVFVVLVLIFLVWFVDPLSFIRKLYWSGPRYPPAHPPGTYTIIETNSRYIYPPIEHASLLKNLGIENLVHRAQKHGAQQQDSRVESLNVLDDPNALKQRQKEENENLISEDKRAINGFKNQEKVVYRPKSKQNYPSVIVVTAVDFDKYSLEALTKIVQNRVNYVHHHNYGVYVRWYQEFAPMMNSIKFMSDEHRAKWVRIFCVRAAMFAFPEAEWFWYLDQDSLIMNQKVKLEPYLLDPLVLENAILRERPIIPPHGPIKTYKNQKAENVKILFTQVDDRVQTNSYIVKNDVIGRAIIESWHNQLNLDYNNFPLGPDSAITHMLQWHPYILSKTAFISARTINSAHDDKVSPENESSDHSHFFSGDFIVQWSKCATKRLGGVHSGVRWGEGPESDLDVVGTPPGGNLTRVVVASSSRLEDTLEDTRQAGTNVIWNLRGCDSRCCNNHNKENQNGEVQSTVLSHHSLSQLRLLQREDGWSDESGWLQPEQHRGVPSVDQWNEQDWELNEQDDVSQDEVTGKLGHFNGLGAELSGWLSKSHPAHTGTVPLTSPESSVGLVVLELSGQEEQSHQLEQGSLDVNHGDNTQQHSCEVESLQHPHDDEEDQVHNHGDTVGNTGNHSTGLLAAQAQHRTCTARHSETDTQASHVDDDRCQSTDNDSSSRVDGNWVGGTSSRNSPSGDTSLSVDESVGNEQTSSVEETWNEVGEKNVSSVGSACITSGLLRHIAGQLSLETSDSRSGKLDIADPGVSVPFRVTTREPSDEVTVVEEEVLPCESVRVEEEWREHQCRQRCPEPQQWSLPVCNGAEQDNQHRSGTHVDRGVSKSRE